MGRGRAASLAMPENVRGSPRRTPQAVIAGALREGTMTIAPFLDGNVFGPHDIQAMSSALDEVCTILNVTVQAKLERELLAYKIVMLARQGERDAAVLRDRMRREIAHSQSGWAMSLVRAPRHGAL